MSAILALDPGTNQTGWAVLEGGIVMQSGVDENNHVIAMLRRWRVAHGDVLAIEMIASYGMAVGKEVFETCVWIGRFMQAWSNPAEVKLVFRKDVKMHLCGTPRAKDGNIRQALIDKLGAPGTKKAPGGTYGVKSHAWAALAVAVTVAEA